MRTLLALTPVIGALFLNDVPAAVDKIVCSPHPSISTLLLAIWKSPLMAKIAAHNFKCTGFEIVTVLAIVCAPCRLRQSTMPPVLGSSAIAAVIFALAVAPEYLSHDRIFSTVFCAGNRELKTTMATIAIGILMTNL